MNCYQKVPEQSTAVTANDLEAVQKETAQSHNSQTGQPMRAVLIMDTFYWCNPVARSYKRILANGSATMLAAET